MSCPTCHVLFAPEKCWSPCAARAPRLGASRLKTCFFHERQGKKPIRRIYFFSLTDQSNTFLGLKGPFHTEWKKKKIWGFFSFLQNVSSPCRKKKNFPKKNQRGPSDIFSTRSHNFTRASRTKVDNNKGHIMAQCAFNWCLLSMFKCWVSMILPSLASTRPVCAPGSKT